MRAGLVRVRVRVRVGVGVGARARVRVRARPVQMCTPAFMCNGLVGVGVGVVYV